MSQYVANPFSLSVFNRVQEATRPGGGGHSTFKWTGGGGGGAAGVWKPDPVAMRSAHKKYTLS